MEYSSGDPASLEFTFQGQKPQHFCPWTLLLLEEAQPPLQPPAQPPAQAWTVSLSQYFLSCVKCVLAQIISNLANTRDVSVAAKTPQHRVGALISPWCPLVQPNGSDPFTQFFQLLLWGHT